MSYTNEQLLLMYPVEVYKLRLDNKINNFPKGFFKKGDSIKIDVCTKLIIYLIEDILKWSDDQICKNLSTQTFTKNGLGYMLHNIFNGSTYEALNNAYPGKFIKVGRNIILAK